MEFIRLIHSANRYIIILLFIISIYKIYKNWKSNNQISFSTKKYSLFLTISFHIQLILGLLLYFKSSRVNFDMATSMKDTILRFFTVEHIFGAILALILVMIARRHIKKNNGINSPRYAFWLLLLAFIIIFLSIPWPIRNLGITNWI